MEEFTIDEEYRLLFNKETALWDTYQNEELMPKSPEYLYKYYSLNLYSIDSLLRHYFYLSNPGDFNDPFDCNLNLVRGITENAKVEFVSRNNIKNIGISSLSETIDNHLMWAHYTNNYNGFAIKFKGDKVTVNMNEDRFDKYALTSVIYPKEPVRIKNDYPFAMHYVLSTKFKHWSYEKEWRIITQLKQGDNRELEFVPEALQAIYIGHKIPDNNKSAYKLLLEIQEIKFPTIPVYVVYPHPTDLKLEFEKVWN
ncbi:DUF2971 domain-containing protein [Spirosoma pomorum]